MAPVIRNFVDTLQTRFKEKSPLIQILLGPRQVGKTTGVLQFLEMRKGPYHYCSADDTFSGDNEWILEQWQIALSKGPGTLLVIDEIQKVPAWSNIIKSLWDAQQTKTHKLKVLLLGSSSLSLTQGMNESLAGRFELISVYHWDFLESRKLKKMELNTYLEKGGYPKSYSFIEDNDRRSDYVRNAVLNRVIDKDIFEFAIVKKPMLFRQAFEIICCYPAQEISYRKLLGQIQDKGNIEIIKYYISLFEGAFLIKTLQKFSNQEFKVKGSSPKILLLAPCFNFIFSPKNEKISWVFESTVGAKLLALKGSLYYWREGDKEVDFVLVWRKKLIAIEVKSGKKRKACGLSHFSTLFPQALKVIISRDNYTIFLEDPVSFFERLTDGIA